MPRSVPVEEKVDYCWRCQQPQNSAISWRTSVITTLHLVRHLFTDKLIISLWQLLLYSSRFWEMIPEKW